MDPIHKFLNIVSPIVSFFLFIYVLPVLALYRLLRYCIGSVFPENLAGKVVLITGASAGIGEQLAYEYAKHGARLALVARRVELLSVVAGRAKELGSPEVIMIKADVSKIDDCKRFVEETVGHFGDLDCLINNAAIGMMGLFEDQESITDLISIMVLIPTIEHDNKNTTKGTTPGESRGLVTHSDVNFWGSVNATHFALPHLRKSKGRIVVISSCGVWFNTPQVSVYNASKAAQQSFFETLRIEVAPDIGVTIVTPGLIDTHLATDKFVSKANLETTPLLSAEQCAKSIVNSVRRGEEYLTEPQWMRSIFLWVVMLREFMNMVRHFFSANKGKTRLPDPKHD